jgi:hypothetical protein
MAALREIAKGLDASRLSRAEGGRPPASAGGGSAVAPPAERGDAIDRSTSPGDIPPMVLMAYQASAATIDREHPGCHLQWPLLAGIGRIESDHAASGGSWRHDWDGVAKPRVVGPALSGGPGIGTVPDTDRGRLDGDLRWDHAVGPMQFLPATWAAAGRDGDSDHRADPENIRDSTLTAAAYLCGRSVDLNDPTSLAAAVYGYNHSLSYVRAVLSFAVRYAGAGATGSKAPGSALSAHYVTINSPRTATPKRPRSAAATPPIASPLAPKPRASKHPAPKHSAPKPQPSAATSSPPDSPPHSPPPSAMSSPRPTTSPSPSPSLGPVAKPRQTPSPRPPIQGARIIVRLPGKSEPVNVQRVLTRNARPALPAAGCLGWWAASSPPGSAGTAVLDSAAGTSVAPGLLDPVRLPAGALVTLQLTSRRAVSYRVMDMQTAHRLPARPAVGPPELLLVSYQPSTPDHPTRLSIVRAVQVRS